MPQPTNTAGGLQTRPQAVFFDLDQTLLQHTHPVLSHACTILLQLEPDRPAAQLTAFEAALTQHAGGLWHSVGEWSGRGEQALTQTLARALQQAGYDSGLASRLLHLLLELTAKSIELTRGADATLDGLAASGILVGIITNGFSVFQNYKARSHRLLDRVQVLVTSEDAGAHKPDRRVFDLALARLNVRAEHAWYVGDSLDKDIAGAMRAGLTSILFDPDRHFDPALSEFRPSYVVNELTEVLQLASAE